MEKPIYAGRTLKEWIKLLDDPDKQWQRWAVEVLGKIGPQAEPAVPTLIKRLNAEGESVRSAAAFALGKIGPGAADAVPAMVKAFWKSGYFHQGIIIQSLAGIGPAAVPALIEISKQSEDARSEALEVLGKIGPQARKAIPHLKAMLTDRQGVNRRAAAFALWKLTQDRAAIPIIARTLSDPNEYARSRAAGDLGEIGPDAAEAVPALIRALDDSSQSVMNGSATALGKIGPAAKDAVPVLVRCVDPLVARLAKIRAKRQAVPSPVQSPDRKPLGGASREFVTEALGKIGAPGVPELIRGLKDRDDYVRSIAAESLGRIGPDAREAVPAHAEMANDRLRALAAQALWRIAKDERAIPILMEYLQTSSANNQTHAMTILAEIGPAGKDAVPLLISVLNRADPYQGRDTSMEKRRPEEAAKTLGRIGPEARAAVPALEAALKDPDGGVRIAAGLALWRIARSELALKALSESLLDPDQNTRFHAAMALGEIGSAAKSAVPALIEALKNDPSIRSITAKALGQIGPAAKAAVPALVEVFENDTTLTDDNVPIALKAIDPKTAALEGIR